MSRLRCCVGVGWGWLSGACVFLAVVAPSTAQVEVARDLRAEVVVGGVPRPVQLAVDASAHLVILSHGWRGDAAAELYRLELAALPLDASRSPHMIIPFSEEPRKVTLGSLALNPRSGDLFMGEENGNRIYRLTTRGKLVLFGVGLNHLLGGSSLAFDRCGRLVVLDYTSPEVQQRSEAPPPVTFEGLGGDAYRGPVVVRLDPQEHMPVPRRFDLIAPIFPRGSAHRTGIEPLFQFISAATTSSDAIVLLDSAGELFTLTSGAGLRPLARLPAGYYHRTHMAVGPDGSVFVSTGFQIRQILQVSPAGDVTVVARDLADPEGIALDGAGNLYVAENALHRVIRIRPLLTPPPASPR